jgi:hypothetical protein
MSFLIQASVLLVEDSSLKLLHRVFKKLKTINLSQAEDCNESDSDF